MQPIPSSSTLPTETSSSSATKVAFLGPLGTYSHQVTSDFFGSSIDLCPVERIADVFSSVTTLTTKYGVVPIENSSIGPVAETMNCLRATTLSVRGMVPLPIGHALLGQKGVQKRDVKTVYSHEQGLGQCLDYLEKHYPSVTMGVCDSTAAAAVLASSDPQSLAICSLKCAEVYGLEVVDTNIQDGGVSNTTRFVVISLPDVPLEPQFPVATSQVPQRPPIGSVA